MKTISLWQPWASLIACGAKRIETRGWSTKYRGPLAIHAAKRPFTVGDAWAIGPETLGEMEKALNLRLPTDLPAGCIVATATLADCVPVSSFAITTRLSCAEKLFGDYSAGRFGWILTDVTPLRTPLPWRGMQRLFEIPDEVFSTAGELRKRTESAQIPPALLAAMDAAVEAFRVEE